ncbi:TPA: hypothetical protein RI762_003520 [Vibrio cholerae]|uniref:hypothetical protein n=1 Tax=Vibrio cholerae TaxID=666 RepID=UPI00118617F8|nr:hypothetical protein [Vibrio cholerae]EGR0311537.1 hypothetical protein [Vibrio cholerae]ELJ8534944.1 hypothetical protein [Vibrio cholerae]TVN35055.1 hypothetical protein FPW41_11830 [Vibrio cholerae]HDV5287791.1 hypothetical protein [Vibrio cholerae]HDV5291311.1 hypothetical protein [Vibrio cholerae]
MPTIGLNEIISMVAGLSGFLGAVWINRIRLQDKSKHDYELEKIRSEISIQSASHNKLLERLSAVHKSKFEKEFSAIQELWELYDQVYVASTCIMSIDVGLSVEKATESNGLTENIKKQAKLCNQLSEKVRFYAPFVCESLFDDFGKSIEYFANVNNKAISALYSGSASDYENILTLLKEEYDAMSIQRENIMKLIRERISSLHVVE